MVTRSVPSWAGALGLACILCLFGCEDDPAAPSQTPDKIWNSVNLGAAGDRTVLRGVACGGGRALALGAAITGGGFESTLFERQSDGAWALSELELPQVVVWFDLHLNAAGEEILVGGTESPAVMNLLDRRVEPATTESTPGFAFFSVHGDGDFLVAGGLNPGGELWSSTVPGVWEQDVVPVTGTNDSGFWDVEVRGTHAVAAGFDDGANVLQVILTRTVDTGWTPVDVEGIGFATSIQCIALAPDGAIFVGGRQEGGSPNARAFLSLYANGEWTDLVLPRPSTLGTINDILLTDDDGMWLACGGEVASTQPADILRVTESGIVSEIDTFMGQISQLARAADGTIYAAGFAGETGTEEARLLERKP